MNGSVIQCFFLHGFAPHRGAGPRGVAQPNAVPCPAASASFPTVGGNKLPAEVCQKMQSYFATSFSDVRVHVGPQAAGIGAIAFTYGSHIHFAPGQYNPQLSHGQRILGHELAHVMQQRAGRVRNPFGAGVAVVHDPILEAEADRAGTQAASHRSAQAKLAPTAVAPRDPRRGVVANAPAHAVLTRPQVVQRMLTLAGSSALGSTCPVPGPFNLSFSTTCSLTPEATLQDLEMKYKLLRVGPPSRERFLAIERVEREIQWAKEAIEKSKEFRPSAWDITYENSGYWKDWVNSVNTGLWSYPSDPTKIKGVEVLSSGMKLDEGYYAYAYRVVDNKIAVSYTGTNANTNNAVSHSYLASGKSVYAAGMIKVAKSGAITHIDSASGHYLPDPKHVLNFLTCDISSTSMKPLENVKNRLADLGFNVKKARLVPFSHPSLVKEKIDCGKDPKKFGLIQ